MKDKWVVERAGSTLFRLAFYMLAAHGLASMMAWFEVNEPNLAMGIAILCLVMCCETQAGDRWPKETSA